VPLQELPVELTERQRAGSDELQFRNARLLQKKASKKELPLTNQSTKVTA
jgi:hypothetical protein